MILVERQAVTSGPQSWQKVKLEINNVKFVAMQQGSFVMVVLVHDTPQPLPADFVHQLQLEQQIDRRQVLPLTIPQVGSPQTDSRMADELLAIKNTATGLVRDYYRARAATFHAEQDPTNPMVNSRVSFKMGLMSEFHADWENAIAHYRTAYTSIRDMVAAANPPPGTPLLQWRLELLALAEWTHTKLLTLLVLSGRLAPAHTHWQLHLRTFAGLLAAGSWTATESPALKALLYGQLAQQYEYAYVLLTGLPAQNAGVVPKLRALRRLAPSPAPAGTAPSAAGAAAAASPPTAPAAAAAAAGNGGGAAGSSPSGSLLPQNANPQELMPELVPDVLLYCAALAAVEQHAAAEVAAAQLADGQPPDAAVASMELVPGPFLGQYRLQPPQPETEAAPQPTGSQTAAPMQKVSDQVFEQWLLRQQAGRVLEHAQAAVGILQGSLQECRAQPPTLHHNRHLRFLLASMQQRLRLLQPAGLQPHDSAAPLDTLLELAAEFRRQKWASLLAAVLQRIGQDPACSLRDRLPVRLELASLPVLPADQRHALAASTLSELQQEPSPSATPPGSPLRSHSGAREPERDRAASPTAAGSSQVCHRYAMQLGPAPAEPEGASHAADPAWLSVLSVSCGFQRAAAAAQPPGSSPELPLRYGVAVKNNLPSGTGALTLPVAKVEVAFSLDDGGAATTACSAAPPVLLQATPRGYRARQVDREEEAESEARGVPAGCWGLFCMELHPAWPPGARRIRAVRVDLHLGRAAVVSCSLAPSSSAAQQMLQPQLDGPPELRMAYPLMNPLAALRPPGQPGLLEVALPHEQGGVHVELTGPTLAYCGQPAPLVVTISPPRRGEARQAQLYLRVAQAALRPHFQLLHRAAGPETAMLPLSDEMPVLPLAAGDEPHVVQVWLVGTHAPKDVVEVVATVSCRPTGCGNPPAATDAAAGTATMQASHRIQMQDPLIFSFSFAPPTCAPHGIPYARLGLSSSGSVGPAAAAEGQPTAGTDREAAPASLRSPEAEPLALPVGQRQVLLVKVHMVGQQPLKLLSLRLHSAQPHVLQVLEDAAAAEGGEELAQGEVYQTGYLVLARKPCAPADLLCCDAQWSVCGSEPAAAASDPPQPVLTRAHLPPFRIVREPCLFAQVKRPGVIQAGLPCQLSLELVSTAQDALQVGVALADSTGYMLAGERNTTITVPPCSTARLAWGLLAHRAGHAALPRVQLSLRGHGLSAAPDAGSFVSLPREYACIAPMQ